MAKERPGGQAVVRQPAVADVPDGVGEALGGCLAAGGLDQRQVFVDVAGDDVEEQALGLARLLVEEELQALGRAVAQPLLDREPVAARLADLLALLVEEELVGEVLGRHGTQHAADLAAEADRIDQVLARHLVVDLEGGPAHRPVGPPLQLAGAAGHRHLGQRAVLVLEDDGAALGVQLLDLDLEDAAASWARRAGRGCRWRRARGRGSVSRP